MPDLPAELWIAILDKLRSPSRHWGNAFPDPFDKPTLKAITLTSHFFLFLAEPFLYERFRVRGRGDNIISEIDRRTRRPLWVKYVLTFNCGSTVTQYLFSIFPQLRALRGVALHYGSIEAPRIPEILQLPFLEIWESISIQVKGDFQAAMIVPENLRLKHVGLAMGYSQSAEKEAGVLTRLALSDHLESLKLMRGTRAIVHILNVAANLSSFHRLHSIELGEGAPPAFDILSDFLRRCPNVTYLYIREEIPSIATLPSAPSDILPGLQKFKGPPRTARLFIQNRPVEHIVLLLGSSQRPENVAFETLNTSSTPIKSLYLKAWYAIDKTALGPLASAFPSLEFLVIEFLSTVDRITVRTSSNQLWARY